MDYSLSVGFVQAEGIFNTPQINQIVTAHGFNQYQMCIPEGTGNVTVQLKSFTDACMCPSSYVWLDMVISKTNPNTMTNGVSWKLESGDQKGVFTLQETDPNTRYGVYYLNVIGTCDSTCLNLCNCGPCSNLKHSKYALLVTSSEKFANEESTQLNIGVCDVQGVTGGKDGYCDEVCYLYPNSNYGVGVGGSVVDLMVPKGWGSATIAGVVMMVFLCLVIMAFSWRYRHIVFKMVRYLLLTSSSCIMLLC